MKGSIKIKSKYGCGSNFILAFPTVACQETSLCKELLLHSSQELANLFDRKIHCYRRTLAYCVGIYGRQQAISKKLILLLLGVNCLVLDDNPENNLIMENLLTHYGFKVTCATSPNEALSMIPSLLSTLDLIITDLRMPEMSGQEFILKVREIEAQKKLPKLTPVIVLTGENNMEDINICKTQGKVSEVLLKPCKLIDIIHSAYRILNGAKEPVKKIVRVLVVEDEAMSRTYLQNVLEKQGHNVIACGLLKEVRF